MPYDIYRNWGTDHSSVELLKAKFIEDLAENKDDLDKLEVIDSFEAFVKRVHTTELAELFSKQLLVIFQPF